MVAYLKQLGFPNVVNRNRDFYTDIKNGQVPEFDCLVSNPPFSGDHKERCLKFCVGTGKPWALLLPNYVANKLYFKDAICDCDGTVLYLVPG